MPIDYSILGSGSSERKRKSKIDYSILVPQETYQNTGLNAPEESFKAWKGDVQPAPIEQPTADAYRALKGDITQADALRMLKGDIQPSPTIQPQRPFLDRVFSMPTQSELDVVAQRTQPSALERGNRALDEYLQSTAPGRFLTRASEQAGGTATFGASMAGRQPTDVGGETSNTIADIIGTLLGFAANPAMGLAQPVEQITARGIQQVAPRLTGTLGERALTTGAGQAAVGTGLQAGEETTRYLGAPEQFNLGEAAKRTAETGALFGGLGAAMPVAGQAIRSVVSRLRRPPTEQPIPSQPPVEQPVAPRVEPVPRAPEVVPETPPVRPTEPTGNLQSVLEENLQNTRQTLQSQQMRQGISALESQKLVSGIEKAKIKSLDPEIERATTATVNAVQGIKGWVNNTVNKIADGFRRYFVYRSELKAFPRLRNEMRKMEDAAIDANKFSEQALNGVVGGLRDRAEYEVFRRMVVIRDLIETGTRGEKLPQGLTVEGLQAELQRLDSLATPEVRTAIEKNDKLMRAVADDLVNRGKLSEESIRTGYYPHRVLEYATDLDKTIPNLPSQLRTPNRFYTKQRAGSLKDIDTNYINVMHKMLSKIQLDNKLDDFVQNTVKEFDALPALAAKGEPKIGRSGQIITGEDGKKYAFWSYGGETYLLPEPVYQHLKDFKQAQKLTPLGELKRSATTLWKRVTLDFAGIGFHVNNMLGDLEALYREDIKAFTKIPQAIRALTPKRTAEDVKLLDLAAQERILQSGITESWIGSVFSQAKLAKFEPKYKRALLWMNPFKIVETFSTYRDAIPRLSKFIADVERIQQGKNIVTKTVNIEVLAGVEAAGKVSREAFIDYGKVTPENASDIRGFLFPFATFYTQNFKNWARYIAKHPVEAGAKLGIPFTAMMMWNNTGERAETEKGLPDYYKFTPHIVTGYTDEKGKPVIITFSNASAAAASILGLEKVPEGIRSVLQGEKTIGEAVKKQLKETALAPLKSAGELASPFLRATGEELMNRSFLTGAPIVPERLKGTPEEKTLRAQHIASQLFTPYGQYQRAQQQVLEPGSTALQTILNQPLNIAKGLGIRSVDLEAVRRGKVYEAADKAREQYKTQKAELEKAYVQSVLTGDKQPILDVAKKYQTLTMDDINNLSKEPRVLIKIINERLKQVSDPQERARLEGLKKQLQTQQLSETLKTVPKRARPFIEQNLKEGQ